MEKITLLIFFTSLCCVLGNSSYYSSYYGHKLSSDEVTQYTANSTLANCTNLIAACDPFEGRRLDGSCNNLDHPSYGAMHTPHYRILEADYYQPSESKFEPKRSVTGEELELVRAVRTKIWAEGRADDEIFASNILHFAVFFNTDITNTHDTANYVYWRPYCCKKECSSDYICTPHKVPATDPVHRFSGIDCLNFTRPLDYQTSGCLPNTTTPLRIVENTPMFDLSPVYGNVIERGRRTYSGGKLATVTVNNRTFPDKTNNTVGLGINFFAIIFFWRHHNFIATELASLNPCWTDEQLFVAARDINIAVGLQIFYYELMATFMGYDNLVKDGVLSSSAGFREIYDSNVLQQIALEFPVALRWLHGMQDGDMRMYYTNGTYKSSYPYVDLTSNLHFLMEEDNMDYATQGCFRQPTGNSKDFVADSDIVQRGLGNQQRSNDIMTNDLAKNRYFGLQGYIHYRKYCFGDEITSFDDLYGIVDVPRITQLKVLYKDVEDIDLLAGIWVEKLKEGTHVPPTFYCLVTEQLKRTLVSDRHWYERKDRPNAFTSEQLAEIRKASIARLLCDVGDAVTEIQPKAFELPTTDNVIVSCDTIPALDLSTWTDSTCSK